MNKLAVLFLGTHGSGKSTICANVLKTLQPEVGAQVWGSTPADSVPRAVASGAELYRDVEHATQVQICWRVVVRLVRALLDHDIVLVDRFLVDSLAYISTAPKLAGKGMDEEVDSLLRFFIGGISNLQTLIYVPVPNFIPDSDGFRPEDEQYRQAIHVLVLGHLNRLGLGYTLLDQPTLEERVEAAAREVHDRWVNLGRGY